MNKNAIKVLKDTVKVSSDAGRAIARQIQTLKFRTADAARQYGELRRQKGNASLRAERKALRNPDSGGERYDLWNQKRGQGDVTRHHLLALGFLRGRAYLTLERACAETNKPSARWIHENISAAFVQAGEACPWTQVDVEAWLAGAAISEAAAE